MIRYLIGFFALLTTHFLLLQRITFTAWPEMFSYPYFINNSFLIYKDFAHPYEPILSFILASIYNVFGYDLIVHKLFVWSLIGLIDLIIFLGSVKIIGKKLISFLPLLLFIFLQPVFDGNMLWFDLGVTPFIILGLVSFLVFKQLNTKFFFAGLFWSVGVFVKQQVTVVLILISVYLILFRKWNLLRLMLIGFLIPAFFVFLTLLLLGVFPEYTFWTVVFPLYWIPKFPGYIQMPDLNQIFYILLLILPVIYYSLKRLKRLDEFQKISLIVLFSALLISLPRFSYFHLQPAIAVYALFMATILNVSIMKKLLFFVPAILVVTMLWIRYQPFYGVSQARFYDEDDKKLAQYISLNFRERCCIYLMGPHPLIYALSNKLPVKPLIENYIWYFEIPGMQDKFIEGLKSSPKTVIFKYASKSGNWFDLDVYQPDKIIKFINDNYKKVATKKKDGLEVWVRN